MDPADRLQQLRREIRQHEELYYAHNAPEISDEAFDRLLHELERLEAEHPDPSRPTRRRSASRGGRPMGSPRSAISRSC